MYYSCATTLRLGFWDRTQARLAWLQRSGRTDSGLFVGHKTVRFTALLAGLATSILLLNGVSVQAQCADVSISATPAASACKQGVADVRWVLASSNVRHTVSANSLTKTSGGNSWNGNGFSRQAVGNNGYMETTVVGTNTERMIGLSATDANADWNTIQYAFYLTSWGALEIRESGSGNQQGGLAYANGDVLRISVENNVVTYYRNGTAVYMSTAAPTLPLYVDVSTNTLGAVVSNVKVANGTQGAFTAVAVNTGTSPSYQWKLNGVNVGTNSANYSNNGLNQDDVVTCEVTASANGCSPGTVFTSNQVLVQDIDQTLRNSFRIQPTAASSACRLAVTDVVWRQPATSARNTVNGTNVTKVSGGNNWNANAFSWQSVDNSGYMETTVLETNRERMIGLSASDANADWNTIQYAFYLTTWGALEIRESGSGNQQGGLTYVAGDVLRIAVENNLVKYYRNGVSLYISTAAPTLPLFVDGSINGVGGTLRNVKVANGVLDTFTATATNAGVAPSYQWRLNGTPVGTNSPTYTNATLANGDAVTCDLTPDLALCPGSSYTSNTIAVLSIDQTLRNEFRIEPVTAASACRMAMTDVVWRLPTSAARNTVSGNNLSKVSGGNNWNANGFSWQPVTNNGYMETTVVGTSTERMIGLSASDVNADWNTIQYAFYLTPWGALEIRESGSGNQQGGLTYANGDVLRIAMENNLIKYYRNGAVLYISTTAPAATLYVDVSLNSVGANVSQVKVANGVLDTFMATATSAGATPTFQWRLNGIAVGTNSPSYANGTLSNGDILVCRLTPDLAGCSTSAFTSDTIVVQSVDQTLRNEFRIEPITAASACRMAVTDVVWRLPTSAARNTVSGNNLSKMSGGNNWNANGFSWQPVTNNGCMETTVVGANTDRMIGLSGSDVNADWNTIQYAFFLTAWGNLEIRENGSGNQIANTPYATGDVLRIAMENNLIKYYRNGAVLYISTTAPAATLYVDVSLNSVGANVSQVKVANGVLDTFMATATSAGAAPTYQWRLNGVAVGTNSPNYANSTLSNGDILVCRLTPDLAGCATSALSSDTIVVQSIDQTLRNEFRIEPVAAASACRMAVADVVWRLPTSAARNTVSGNNLSKVSGGNNWNANGSSWQPVTNNGYMESTVVGANTERMIGLSATDANADWNTIQYAFFLTSSGSLEIRESGSGSQIGFTTYANGDVLRIAMENNLIKYYRNGAVLYISTTAPAATLYVDVSLNSVGANVSQVKVANGVLDTFTATATSAGAAPTYEWRLNGSVVGTNSATYINASLSNNDVLVCRLIPDLAGCASSAFTSDTIVVQANDQTVRNSFRISSTIEPDVCVEALTDVVWRLPTSAARNTVNGNAITKVSGGTNWNANGFSWQSVGNNGYMETTVVGTNTERMIGLSASDANADWNTIQYAFYMTPWGSLEVRENGSGNLAGFHTYASGDVLRIAVENSVVRYFRNGSLLFTSTQVPAATLFVDVSLSSVGANVSSVRVGNGTVGSFTAAATNAGTAPTYQWRLNGTNVGTNNANYSNGSLVNGDIVTCVLTPDLAGCASSAFTSNAISIVAPGAVTTNWIGATNAWNTAGNWSNGVPNKRRNAVINAGLNPVISTNAQVNNITIAVGRTLTINASNTLEVFGNWNNQGTFTANTSTVRFQGCASGNTIQTPGTQNFYNAAINNRFDITVTAGTHNVTNNLNFQRGDVINQATLQVQTGATATGMSDQSHVVGFIRKAGTQAFTFPVGNGTIYRPISISAPGSNSTFNARYNDVNSTGLYPHAQRVPSINNLSLCEYWDLNRPVGAANVSVTLSWNNASVPNCQVILPSDLLVAGWSTGASQWQDRGNGSTTGSAASGTITSSSAVSVFGPFTLASAGGLNPLPIELLSFTAELNGYVVDLKWATASERDNAEFIIERSKDALSFDEVFSMPGAGNSSSVIHYTGVDDAPLPGISYYRLKQVDFDGSFAYSDVVAVQREASLDEMNITLFPNPSMGDLNVVLSDVPDEEIWLGISDGAGRLVLRERVSGTRTQVHADQLPAGTYTVVLTGNTRTLDRKQWVKL